MTIGTLQIQGPPIQVDSHVYQAAHATPVVSASMVTSGTGGLLQSLVPTHGVVICTTSPAMSTGTAAIDTAATQLVASGIKNFKL